MTDDILSVTIDWAQTWHEGDRPFSSSRDHATDRIDEESQIDIEPFEWGAKETGCHTELRRSYGPPDQNRYSDHGFDVTLYHDLGISGAAAAIAAFLVKMQSTIKAVLQSKRATIEFTVGQTKLKYSGPMAEEEAAAICERILAIAEEAATKTRGEKRRPTDDKPQTSESRRRPKDTRQH
jgi:hypothetical protein